VGRKSVGQQLCVPSSLLCEQRFCTLYQWYSRHIVRFVRPEWALRGWRAGRLWLGFESWHGNSSASHSARWVAPRLCRTGAQRSRLARARGASRSSSVSCGLVIWVALEFLYGRAADGLGEDRRLFSSAPKAPPRARFRRRSLQTRSPFAYLGLEPRGALKTVNASVHHASPVKASPRLHGCFPMAVVRRRNPARLRIFPCPTGIPRERPGSRAKFFSLRVLR